MVDPLRSEEYPEWPCPQCSGPLHFARDVAARVLEWRVGHRSAVEASAEMQSEDVAKAIGVALTTVLDRLDQINRLDKRMATQPGGALLQQRFAAQREEMETAARTLVRCIQELAPEVLQESPLPLPARFP